MTKSPFNDYDENGIRKNINGNLTSRTADENLLYNLRFKFPELDKFGDAQLINGYDDFALSEDFGNNDEKFVEWMEGYDE